MNCEFYKDKTILVTGHTGFKGAWLCEMLLAMGAKVIGYALPPEGTENLYGLLGLEQRMDSVYADIRNLSELQKVFDRYQPEIIIHMAAQPIVREGYRNPHYTYETNVMGTVNVLECIRQYTCVKSFLNVTTDKVYANEDSGCAFLENMPLDGADPYSNSKSCSELVTHAYLKSYFENRNISVSCARAGNVIGGGDFAADRIIPDCFRAARKKEPVVLRNPNSIRPYQHVLEPLFVYLLIVEKQYGDKTYQGWYNVGPEEMDCITTGELTELFGKYWGQGFSWETTGETGPREAKFLRLNCDKLKKVFGWQPKWNIEETVQRTAAWYKAYAAVEDIKEITDGQIGEILDV